LNIIASGELRIAVCRFVFRGDVDACGINEWMRIMILLKHYSCDRLYRDKHP